MEGLIVFYGDINLQQEVYRQDVIKIVDWLRDEEVSEFLNEENNVVTALNTLVDRSTLPILTQYFSNNGPFYMIEHKNDPIGYLKLVPKGKKMEMVITIGDKEKWGRGYGTIAIKKGISEAFFNYKVDKVIAKINKKNTRSRNLFKKVGFEMEESLKSENLYTLSFNKYISQYN